MAQKSSMSTLHTVHTHPVDWCLHHFVNVICKMTMQYVKWHCILYLNVHFTLPF